MKTDTFAASPSRNRLVLRTGDRDGALSLGAVIASAAVLSCASVPIAGSAMPGAIAFGTSAVPAFLARDEEVSYSASSALGEIRRRAALTWDQVGKLLGVSRRAVHQWMNGGAMKPEHQNSLQTLLGKVRAFKGKSPFLVRQALLSGHDLSPTSNVVDAAGIPIPVYDQSSLAAPIVIKRAENASTRVQRG